MGSLLLLILISACGGGQTKSVTQQIDTIALSPCPEFSADSAMRYIREQCNFGPRVTATGASQQCGDYLIKEFERLGATVEEQKVTVKIYDGTRLPARNIIAHVNPEATDRIMLCSHWDSRPWADNDPDEANHHTPVMAANDGASGVAVMMEICRLLQQQPITTGLDLVCFDAEDMGTPEWGETSDDVEETWCLGSYEWAQKASENGYKARYGVLLDMVGGYGATFSKERISLRFAEPMVRLIWRLAGQLGYGQFFPNEEGGYITDDHINVNTVAGIPCVDIIPYYKDGPSSFGPTWHTVNDTPDNIDPNVLKAVGQTLTQLIYNEN